MKYHVYLKGQTMVIWHLSNISSKKEQKTVSQEFKVFVAKDKNRFLSRY